MTPTFNKNIPQPTDRPSNSQGDLLRNFQAIDAIWKINHEALDDSVTANRGKHTVVVMTQQSSPTTIVGEGAMYIMPQAPSPEQTNVPELFFRGESNGQVIQMTASPRATEGERVVKADPGTTFLPGGIMMKFGTAIMLAGTQSTAVTYATPFPNTAYIALITWGDERTRPVYASNFAGASARAGFTANTGNNILLNAQFSYIAIGS